MELRKISYKNPFFYKDNRFSREIHTYSETDYIERYNQISIWKFETTCRNDGSRLFDLVVDDIIIETLGGEINTIEKVRTYIDNLKTIHNEC